MVMFLPYLVNASEKCTIVSGNGKDIGSEIDCAGEHFYVIEDKQNSLRMLAKYNLDIGYEYNKVIVSEERYNEIKELCSGSSYCNDVFEEEEFKGYTKVYDYYQNEDGNYTYMISNVINFDEIKQNPKAIGAHGGVKGEPEFPEYGILNGFPINGQIESSVEGEIYDDKFLDFSTENINFRIYTTEGTISFYLNDYKNELINKSYDIVNIDLLSVRELSNIIFSISSNKLPLKDWAQNEWEEVDDLEHEGKYYIIGSIKEYLPEGYEWIYNTTYWTKTVLPVYYGNDGNYYVSEQIYFIDTLGNLCNGAACNMMIGAGIRPVIEIDKASIKYNVVLPEEEMKGSVELVENENENLVSFRVFPKTGYKFEGVTLITDSGEKIELTEKEVIIDADGIMTISEDKFKMGYENVRLEVKWGEDIFNPKTGVKNITGLMFTILLILVSGLFVLKNYNKSYEI